MRSAAERSGYTSSTVGRVSRLDQATRGKLEAACNYINAEIAKVRGRVVKFSLAVGVLAAIGYAFMWNNGVRDPRFPLFGALGLIVKIGRAHV